MIVFLVLFLSTTIVPVGKGYRSPKDKQREAAVQARYGAKQVQPGHTNELSHAVSTKKKASQTDN